MRAVVTGAARGLGAAVADRLATDGAAVAYVDVDGGVSATAAAAAAGGGRAVGRVADVSDEAAVQELVADIATTFGGVDLLVNCAGIGGPADAVVDLSLQDFRRTLDVNLLGSFLMARAVAARLIDQGTGGAIVNIGSLFGQQGVAGGAPYCASKGALATLTHTLAHELGPHGIRVNTIAPGHMDTKMHAEEVESRARRTGTTVDAELQAELRSIPLGRFGTGQDIAGTVAWLASPDAGFVTGQTIAVNGGVLMS